jgi:hypothetical protein
MSGRRTEIPHYTPEQVNEHLREANRIVSELDLPEHLQPVAYRKAIELLAAKNITVETAAALPMLAVPQSRGH